jgi:uncharacterized YccA/Bax inhibitor family protein
MPNPVLSEKGFERAVDESESGWAMPDALTVGEARRPPVRAARVMTANGTFARAFALFLLVLAGGAFGWSQVEPTTSTGRIDLPTWFWVALIGALGVALVCALKPRLAPALAPVYAVVEGFALGMISRVFEVRWDGIVLQAILATIAVFSVTLALYVFDVVRVTRRFQLFVLGATVGVLGVYMFGFVMSLFGVDLVFWNQPSALGIIVTAVIASIAALNLFLDYEFIRQASLAGAPKHMEWYAAFGLMVTLVWLYLELLRLLSLLRR